MNIEELERDFEEVLAGFEKARRDYLRGRERYNTCKLEISLRLLEYK